MGLGRHFTLPKNAPASTPSGRLAQYESRRDLARTLGAGVSVFLLFLVIAVATTDFSKDAPGWLRATTVVLMIAGVLFIGYSWVDFRWRAMELSREIEERGDARVGAWPAKPEALWTIGLYVLILNFLALITLTVWASV